jgi:hypothetical protein
MRRYSLLLLFLLSLLTRSTAVAQTVQALPADPASREQALHALRMIRMALASQTGTTSSSPSVRDGDDAVSQASGTITGVVGGVSDSIRAWVLIVSAELVDNADAWQLVNVDDDGHYQAAELADGRYYLMAGADGYQPQFYPKAQTLDAAEVVGVVAGEIVSGIDFFLEPTAVGTGVISGTVNAAGGTALAEAHVLAYDANLPFRTFVAVTGTDGTYRIEHVVEGDYIVEASAAGHSRRYYDDAEGIERATRVSVRDGDVVSGIDFALPRSGSISGHVRTPDGEPIAGASIFASRGGDANPDSSVVYPFLWATTDENGTYTVSDLTEGDYFVQALVYGPWFAVFAWYDGVTRFEDATPVPVADGEDTPNIDFELDTAGNTGRIAGRVVTADGEPVVGAYLHVEPFDNRPIFLFAHAFTNETGEYIFENVPEGDYRVALDYWSTPFYATIWYDNVFDPSEATAISVKEDQTTSGIVFTLPRADGVIEGRITDNDGKPIAGAYVFASNGPYGYLTDVGFGVGYAVTDGDGAYAITHLIDGDYYVWASACVFWQCVQRWWPDGNSFEEAKPVVLAEGVSNPASVDITLPIEQGSATISGTVRHVDGRLLAGAFVSVARTNDAPRPDGTIWFAEQHIYTDSLGAYTLSYLPAGTYTVNASYWEDGGYGIQWYDGAETPDIATPIELGENDVRDGIDFDLDVRPTYGTLAGKVVFDDGAVAGGAYVEVSPSYWDYAMWPINPAPYYTLTKDSGEFEIAGLPNGTYTVDVFAQGGRMAASVDPSTGVGGLQVEIRGGETTNIDIALVRVDEGDGTLSGTVAADDSLGLSFAVVQAMIDDDPNRIYTAIAASNGTYALTGLPDGTYIVWSFAPYHALEYYEETYEPSAAKRVELKGGVAIGGIDFTLSPVYYIANPEDDGPVAGNSSYIFGQVVDEDQKPIAGAAVYALDESGEALSATRTHADGMYELAGVAPGAGIRLKVSHPGFESRFHDGTSRLEDAAALDLSPGRYEINFVLSEATSVGNEPEPELPAGIALRGNYPNPFNPETRISFTLSEPMTVEVTIFDALGRRVTELYRGALPAGEQQLRWDATGAGGETMPSGIYFYRVAGESLSRTGTMTLLR